MKKNRVLMTVIVAFLFIGVTGCGKNKVGDLTVDAGESAIYLDQDGTVSYVMCEDFDKDYYDKGDLKEAIKQEIDDFNAGPSSKETDSASLESFKVKDKKVTAIIEFKSTDDFVGYVKEYNREGDDEIFIGKISDAVDEGIKISGKFTEVKDGLVTEETIKGTEVKKLEDNIIVLKEQMLVQMEGNIKYISENCTIEDGIVTITDDEIAYIVYE